MELLEIKDIEIKDIKSDCFKAYAELGYLTNSLFDTHSWNECIKKRSKEELKDFIIIYYIVGKNYTNGDYSETSKIYEITDSLFNKIEVYYSPHVPDDYIKANFKDTRISDNSFDYYKPYFNLVEEK